MTAEQKCLMFYEIVDIVLRKERKSVIMFSSLVDSDICFCPGSLNMYSSDIFTVSINHGILKHSRNVTSVIFILC